MMYLNNNFLARIFGGNEEITSTIIKRAMSARLDYASGYNL